jgi:hypothetical protein
VRKVDDTRHVTLWVAFGGGFLTCAIGVSGVYAAVVTRSFRLGSTPMLVAFVLLVLAIVCFLCAMLGVRLPQRSPSPKESNGIPKDQRIPTDHKSSGGPNPLQLANELSTVIVSVRSLSESPPESPPDPNAPFGDRMGSIIGKALGASLVDWFHGRSYSKDIKPRALELFDQACELGYKPESDRAEVDQPESLTPATKLLVVLENAERFARAQAAIQ